jgi:hypothetical protein
MGQADPAMGEKAVSVGPTMMDGMDHPLQFVSGGCCAIVEIQNACYAAHFFVFRSFKKIGYHRGV